MEEIWKRFRDSMYEVSNLGRIRNAATSRPLKPYMCKRYLSVGLYIDGERKKMRVHRVVAEAFIGKCPFGHEVNHKDLDKLNNHESNLEYVTPKENIAHAIRNGCRTGNRSGTPRGVNKPGHPFYLSQAKLTHEKARAIRELCKTRKERKETQADIAVQFGISRQVVNAIATNTTWKDA